MDLIQRRRQLLATKNVPLESLILFDRTDNTAVTGGWSKQRDSANLFVMEQGSGLITIRHTKPRTANEIWTYVTGYKIDVTNLTALVLCYSSFFYNPESSQTAKGSVAALLSTQTGIPGDSNTILFKCDGNLLNHEQTNLTLNFDISSLSGEYYFAVGGTASYGVRGNSENNFGLLWEINKIYLM